MKAQTELFPKPEAPVKSLLGPVEKMVRELIDGDALSKEETAVASLLFDHWHLGPITQRGIARTKGWLGCHPKHEADVVANRFDSTTRQVREIIRALRIKHKLPVLADRRGYFLPRDDGEAKAYIARMEKEARARAKASIETYHALRDTLGLASALFDELASAQKVGMVSQSGAEKGGKAP